MESKIKEKRSLNGTVDRIFKRKDKNKKDYLIIKLLPKKDSQEQISIFCFGLQEH